MATKEVEQDNAPSTEEFDWSGITARPAVRLQKEKIKDVPKSIVKHAQDSYDGVMHQGELRHVLVHEFPNEELAAQFAKHMKNAGPHTTPETSISVVIDPDADGNKRLVSWRAGKRRGRKAAGGTVSGD